PEDDLFAGIREGASVAPGEQS
ncbi:MAG: hypothetical protein QOE01_1445, partial [Actinomycetota bacterium]|nr:hypothetical protein [Actinomycetota bacterium]